MKKFIKVKKSPYFAPAFFLAFNIPKPWPANNSGCTYSIQTSIKIYFEQPNFASKEFINIQAFLRSIENYATF